MGRCRRPLPDPGREHHIRPLIEPLRLLFEVQCPAEHAFTVWTARASTWWPRTHSVSGDPTSQVFFEAGTGGRIFERTPDGAEIEWGEITVWEPPRRLGYLWHIRTDRSDATEVEINFIDQGANTRIEIEHRGWERLGARAPGWRDANMAGWNGVLPAYRAACSVLETEASPATGGKIQPPSPV